MQRFEEAENFDVEGVDNKNACYGGTAALMNTVNWVESSSWDGRFGVVVCAGLLPFPFDNVTLASFKIIS